MYNDNEENFSLGKVASGDPKELLKQILKPFVKYFLAAWIFFLFLSFITIIFAFVLKMSIFGKISMFLYSLLYAALSILFAWIWFKIK